MVFDSKKEFKGLEESTFDVLHVDAFYNTRPWTILSYMWVWTLLLLKLAILGSDTYTCVSLLAFNRWSSLEYTVYEYKIAKWIFAGCILFRVALLVYQIAWAVHVFRTRNIALAYLNNYARMMYALRSYNYQCLFHQIDLDGFFEWACFFVYTQLDDALETLVADLPRQVINFMTLRFYATGGDANNAILANIQAIAATNVRLAVVLSLQLASLVIFLFFFFQFVLAMLLFIPIKVKVSHRGFRLLKDICYHYVNSNVRYLVKKNHKLRKELMAEGVMNYEEIQANPLLASESSLDLNSIKNPFTRNYSPYNLLNTSLNMSDVSLLTEKDYQRRPPPRSHTALTLRYDASTLASHDNPFMDSSKEIPRSSVPDRTDLSDIPPPVRPPPRTQTASSLGLYQYRSNTDNSAFLYSNPSSERLTSLNNSRLDFGDIVSTRTTEYPSNPMSRRPPPSPPISPAELDRQTFVSQSGRHIDVDNQNNVNLESPSTSDNDDNKIGESKADEDGALSPYPLNNDLQETPYPVRGVSQYFPDGYEHRDN